MTLHHEVTGDGAPVLLIMGFSMRGVVWRPIVDRLAPDHRLVTYDHRGVGRSTGGLTPFTMNDLGDDAAELAASIGWDRYHVVGVSMGGMVAQELALDHPDQVASLTLIATHGGGRTAFLPPPRTVPRLLAVAASPPRLARRLIPKLLHPEGSLVTVSDEEWAHRDEDVNGIPLDPRVRRQQFRAIRNFDVRDRLHTLHTPTLVVQPGRDRLCRPSHNERLAAALPNATLLRFPDAGHGLILHAADALSDAIRRHIAANP